MLLMASMSFLLKPVYVREFRTFVIMAAKLARGIKPMRFIVRPASTKLAQH